MLQKNLILTVLSLLVVSTLMATTTPNSSATIQKMSQMPLAFTKNMGQWDDRVLFRANAGGATMWFTKEGVTYQFTRHIDPLRLRRGPLALSVEISRGKQANNSARTAE